MPHTLLPRLTENTHMLPLSTEVPRGMPLEPALLLQARAAPGKEQRPKHTRLPAGSAPNSGRHRAGGRRKYLGRQCAHTAKA